MRKACRQFLFFCTALLSPTIVLAQENRSTPSLYGVMGLNTMPSARHAPAGTISAGLSALDPYTHATLGVQAGNSFFIGLRQTALGPGINTAPDRLYPGLDVKFRLLREDRYKPEISAGLQSAFGHRRSAGEYIVASKRYGGVDLSVGMGWGLYGGSQDHKNPYALLGSHFKRNRNSEDERAAGPEDWFTGSNIGYFAGLEYLTPWLVEGLSFKFDWSSQRYDHEEALDPGFAAPAPWSAGIAYSPASWASLGAGIQGLDKLMARLTLSAPLQKWPLAGNDKSKPLPMYTHRSDRTTSPENIGDSARENGSALYDIKTGDPETLEGRLELDPLLHTPRQLGRAGRIIGNNAGRNIETIALTPTLLGLKGPRIQLNRRDLEQAIARQQGSPQEIWRNALFTPEGTHTPHDVQPARETLRTALATSLSGSEEDTGILYRTPLTAETVRPVLGGFMNAGGSVRLNIKDNLDKLDTLRFATLLPVRSNVAAFTAHRIEAERSYLNIMRSPASDWHIGASLGYLEEMYAGLGGEILYRPFRSRWAIGAEGWQAFKRDPYTELAMGLNGDHILSGHINAYYDLPGSDLTVQAKAGRYLAGDLGGTLALSRIFESGVHLEAFSTLTDQADYDLLGGTTHADHGLKLTLPLGHIKRKKMQASGAIKLDSRPLGRDSGQFIDNPLPLYNLTNGFSYKHLSDNWNDVVE